MQERQKEIIQRWGRERKSSNTYIFPVFDNSMDAIRKKAVVNQLCKMVNKKVRMVAKELGIDDHITFYTARHSYATILKNSGANVSYISEKLGHANITTTKNYLDSFEDDQDKEISKALTNF